MSRVFLADETSLGRKVVVKVLPPELAAEVNVERFRREIQVAARLQHPHIVPLLSASEDGALLYYSMPFVDGESLRDRLARDGELPIADAVRLLREISDALSYAHEHGVVHRDIKPENILLSRGHAVVADFGVAKALAAATSEQKLTGTGLALGTPAYMAPEQAVGDPRVDHRADLYALGVVAYEMLAGQPPYAGRSAQATVAAHVTEVPEFITKRRPGVSAPLADLVMRLLEKRAADRPQSADAVTQALDALPATSSGERTAAVSGARMADPRNWSRAAVVSGALILAIALVAGWLGLRPRSPETQSRKQRVAVAPFQNLTGDASLDHVGRIAAEWLSQALVRAESVDVVSPDAVAIALRNSKDGPTGVLARLAAATSAQLVVTGSVARNGPDSVQLRAQVVDARTGKVQSPIEGAAGPTNEPGAAIDVIGERLLSALVSGNAMDVTLKATPPKYAAFQEFDAGQQFARTRDDWVRARPYYERAIAIDSTFALAYNLLALSYMNTGAWEQGDSIVRRIDRLRHRLSTIGRLQLAGLHTRLSGDTEQRLHAVQAMAAHDSSPVSLFLVGENANNLLRPRIAVPALEHSDSIMVAAGEIMQSLTIPTAYHQAASYTSELRVALRARRQFPIPVFLFYQLRAFAGLQKSAEAVALADTVLRSIEDSVGFPVPFIVDGALEFRAHGDSVTARRILEMTRAWYATHPVTRPPPPRSIAEGRVLYLTGHLDSAESRLTRAKTDTTNFDAAGYLALVLLRRGDAARATAIGDSLGVLRRKWLFGTNTEWHAAIVGALGDKERAVQLLKQASKEGASMKNWHSAAHLLSLHGYAPFEKLILPQR
jgi:TolB-like protein